MQLAHVVTMAARVACLAAVPAMCFAASPNAADTPGARTRLECQAVEPKSLAFVVFRVERRPAGEFIVTFENGEVWQQAARNAKVEIQRGDQVVIRRAANGVFTLVSRDGQSTRVNRMH